MGKPVDPGLIARFGEKLRATFDVWFGPLTPLPRLRLQAPRRGRSTIPPA